VAFATSTTGRAIVTNGISDVHSGAELTVAERAAYVIAGLGLAAAGVKPRPNPLLNIIALAGGSYLAWRGYMGTCPVKAALFGATERAARIPDRS
jgi:threonine/homoserine/homoserine lactone efflux protein